MPLIQLKSTVFDAFEDMLTLPQVDLTHADALDALVGGFTAGDPTVLQLSSSLIRVSQNIYEFNGTWTPIAYEIRISGAGIGPVATMDALINAINNGLASGSLSKFAILRQGIEVLGLTLGASGYVLTSGAQSVTLAGHLPLTFTQFFDLADLFNQAVHLDTLTQSQRLALFNDLTAYSVTGLTVKDGADTLFAASVTATSTSLTINGLTFSATGTFPDNFGEDLELLWQISRQIDLTGTVDYAALTGLGVTAVQIKDAAGHILTTIANPLADTPTTWKVDGRSFDQVLMNGMYDDVLTGTLGSTRSVLAGLGGNDDLYGGAATDFLFGGSGRDDLFGGNGADRLTGGQGRDRLTGGDQADVFVFVPRGDVDRITDFVSGLDVIEIRTATRMADLTFTDTGTDVRIDFRSIHIIVEDIGIAALRHAENFLF